MERAPDTATILQSLGELKGEANANFKTLFEHLNLIRQDIHNVERRGQEQVKQLSEHIDQRFIAVEQRITTLEVDNKSQIKEIARNGAISGGITAALISTAVEIFKRI